MPKLKTILFPAVIFIVSLCIFFLVIDWGMDPRFERGIDTYSAEERSAILSDPAVVKNWLGIKYISSTGSVLSVLVFLIVAAKMNLFSYLACLSFTILLWFSFKRLKQKNWILLLRR